MQHNFIMYLFNLALLPLALAALPPTPPLPSPISTIRAPIDGVELWYQQYNPQRGQTPIVMIHGGLGYSAYFGSVISRLLDANHYVIAVDRRGHGRSTYLSSDEFTFPMFAKDTQALLSTLGVEDAYWVGWSDGAATTLAGLLDGNINSKIKKAFVFAGFQSYRDTNSTFTETSNYQDFVQRCAKEYAELQPEANFTDFATKVAQLEGTQPNWSDADMGKIDGQKVWIVGAEEDEAVNLAVPVHLNSVIPGSTLRMLSGVTHFAPLQNPGSFANLVEEFVK